MHFTFKCSKCDSTHGLEWPEPAETVSCDCGNVQTLRPAGVHGRSVTACLVCGTGDLYLQKDFPQRLGLSILGVGMAFSTLAWWQYWYPAAMAFLVLSAAIDFGLYYAVPDVTVCYRCGAQYRGFEKRAEHAAFDLGVGERYRQERLRIEELRERARKS